MPYVDVSAHPSAGQLFLKYDLNKLPLKVVGQFQLSAILIQSDEY
jgi:hypothetical protein